VSGLHAVDPQRFDEAVARAARELAAARRALRLAAAEHRAEAPSPLEAHRDVSARSTWLELGEAPAHPIFAAARPWVFALTVDRVAWGLEAALATAWGEPSILVEGEGLPREHVSAHDLLARVLADPMAARGRAHARALEGGAGKVAELARRLAERRAEATHRLGASADDVELPCPPAAIATAARALLDRTAALLDGPKAAPATWDGAIVAALGRDATEGWPARLGARWLEGLFGATELTRGLALELAPLPRALGAASFARALAAFGDAFAVAAAPRSTPFVLARAPFDVRRARRAALFGGLAADAIFGAKALGLGRDRARDQARAVTRALLRSLRLDAARVLLRGALVLPEHALAPRFEEATALALDVPVPLALAGVVPRLEPGDGTRFAGALLAASDRRALVERFDEDWFRSPHAAHALRDEEAAAPAAGAVAEAALDAGLGELVRALAARLE
jgi:hypothetical protein